MNLPTSSRNMKDKDWKADESNFKHNQDFLMPGFRFHPTEEELVEFYLRRKVEGKHFHIELITSVHLYRYDPWELPALGSIGEKEWFFYVQRDRKYRNGDRPNRVTTSGYWKATGADRMIRNEVSRCIGLKKTLVFYKGKAPKGKRTSWLMNEYRLPQLETYRIQKNELSLCRVYRRSGRSEEGLLEAKERHNGTEIDRITVNENHLESCSVEMQEPASMHQWQTYMGCSNPRTTAEYSCNFEIKTGSTYEIVNLQESPTDVKTMPKSISGEEKFTAHVEYRAPDQSENMRERIYSEGGSVWSTVSRPISLNEDLELSLATCLICPRTPNQLGVTENLYSDDPSYLALSNASTNGACLQTCSDKLWEWNPVRNNGSGTSC